MAIVNVSSYSGNVVEVGYLGAYQGNAYPYSFIPGPNTSDSAIISPSTFGTTQTVEMRVDVDTDPAIVLVDWEAMDADDGWKKDVNNYITIYGDEGQSTSATLGYHITETGEEGQFVRTLTIIETDDGGGGVIVTGRRMIQFGRDMMVYPTRSIL